MSSAPGSTSSIHARQPFAPSFRAESRLAAGYEEGLAEGLARRIMRAQPGMQPMEHTFGRYVAAYETLAARLRLRTRSYSGVACGRRRPARCEAPSSALSTIYGWPSTGGD